jgi:hypothetical protein
MSRQSVLMGVLTIDPTSTSDLYERAGYGALAEAGMIPYHEFRGELEKLQAAGVVESSSGDDGSTMWSLTSESAGES